MAVFAHVPTWSTQLTVDAKVVEARFGDGYSQSSPDGLNNTLEVWNLQFKDIKDAEYVKIKNFLHQHKGSIPFQWTTPDGDTYWFRCKSWSGSPPSANVRDMTMKFEQVMK